MTINDIKVRLGNVDDIEIAQSSCSKGDALKKIVNEIEKQGLDVDEEYLNFVKKLEYENVPVEVKYVPLYYTTNVAKLSWKERKEGEEPTDHVEYVQFNSLFYARQNAKNDRINQLDILKVLDKKVARLNETTPVDGILETGERSMTLIGMQGYVPQVVMDVPIAEGECYDVDSAYVLSQKEVEDNIQSALEETKSYRRLQKQKEKWSNIEKVSIKVVLVPIASVKVGSHDQLVNCANGEMDVQYEKSRIITNDLKKARMIVFPAAITLGLFLIIDAILLLVYNNGPVIWESVGLNAFQSFNGWIWLISLIVGLIFTFIAIPSRGSIVARKTNKKNAIKISKVFGLLIYAIDYSLLILFFMILQYIIAK